MNIFSASTFDIAMKRQFNRADNGMQMYGAGGNQFSMNGGGAGGHGGQKRFRSTQDATEAYQNAITAGKFELRVLIPSRSAGAIIGRGGEYIKTLRTKVPLLQLKLDN
jgi:hypothetical protein